MLTAAIVGQAANARKKEILVLISIFDFCELCSSGPEEDDPFGRGGVADSMFPKGQARLFLNYALIPCGLHWRPFNNAERRLGGDGSR